MCSSDLGVRTDLVEAYKWYLVASRAGDGAARDAVERLKVVLPASERGKARAEADLMTVTPSR